MMRCKWIVGMCVVIWASLAQAETFDYTSYSKLLARVVDDDGLVDYEAAKGDVDLKIFVAQIEKFSPEIIPDAFPTRNDSLAFWINTYNALVIWGVSQAYPIDSVREIAPDFGFFKKQNFVVGGQARTLDDIEHQIIRPQFGDPRIHAAINCAASSCPKLNNAVFMPVELDTQLEDAMGKMVRHKDHVKLDRKARVLTLSAIFNWFASDFTTKGSDETLIDYIRPYMAKEDRMFVAQNRDLKVRFFEYDWTLNDQK